MDGQPAPCRLCWYTTYDHGIHRRVYAYRCSRCGGCYACEHTADALDRAWRCRDGVWRQSIFDTVPVEPKD